MSNRARMGWICLAAATMLVVSWADLRPRGLELRVVRSIEVLNTLDGGPGSFREALFIAGHASEPVKILLPEGIIHLERALPEVGARTSVSIIGHGEGKTSIDGSGSGAVACLEIAAPGSLIRGVSLRHSDGIALLVKSPRMTIEESEFHASRTGVYVSPLAEGLTVERSRFADNDEGIRFEAPVAGGGIVRTEFSGNRIGVWSVGNDGADNRGALIIADNVFDGDHHSIVTANTAIEVYDNRFRGALEASVLMFESNGVVNRNSVIGGNLHGIVLDSARDVSLRQNRIENHRNGVGILVKDSQAVSIRSNTILRNAYGISVVAGSDREPPQFESNTVSHQTHDGVSVIGGHALLLRNEVTANGAYGLRLVAVEGPLGVREAAALRIDENRLVGNRAGDIGRRVERTVPEDIP